jgi:hypothetical protein
MKYSHIKIFFAISAFLLLSASTAAPSRGENLGLSLQILQGNSSASGIESNTRLWFVVSPGQSKNRTIEIRNTSAASELVTLQIGALKRVNGKSELALNDISEIAKWATFSKNNFVLGGRELTRVELQFTVPKSEDINSYGAMLLVKASAASKIKPSDDYSVPSAAQIAAPIFLGVGTEEEFTTRFEIKGIEGVKTSEGKSLRVEIKNTGKTPVAISGDIQAKGITFVTNRVGPFYYSTETINPGETKFADAVVGDLITESKWKIFVSASQGEITETREFDVNISFDGRGLIPQVLMRICIGLISFFSLLWAYRVFRLRNVPMRNSNSRRTKLQGRTDELSLETQALIAELEAKAEAAERKAASLKKSAAKKPSIVKKSAKKSTKKKVAAKGIATSAKPVKRTTTRKATPKMNSTKKVVKKRR